MKGDIRSKDCYCKCCNYIYKRNKYKINGNGMSKRKV